MEYKGQYSIKNPKQPCLCCLQLYTNELTPDLFQSEIEGLLEECVTSASCAKLVLFPCERSRTYWVDRRGIFPNYATALMHQNITSISLASFSCSSQQCSVICHHILMPILSPWSPHPVCTDSHTLTVILQGCFLSHLFPWLCFFTSPQWAGFFSRVGSTLLKSSGSPVRMMRCTWDSPCGTAMKTTHTAWAAATGPQAHHVASFQDLLSTRPLWMPARFTCDSS